MAVVNSAEWWNRMVPRYEERGDYRNRPSEFARSALHVFGPVLEIGCAFGEFTKYLSVDTQYIGFDISQALIEKARARHPDRMFVRANVLKMGVAQWHKTFNTTCAFQVLEHFTKSNLAIVLNKIQSMTRHSLVFSVPRGLPSAGQKKHDGHLIGWIDEEDLAKDWSRWGSVEFHDGDPNHLCGSLVFGD